MYLGFFLVLSAWVSFLGSALSLLLLPAFVIYMNRFQIVPEERFMHENFGESYKNTDLRYAGGFKVHLCIKKLGGTDE
jgi:protein-S-isoprenylcysteine O-methyltransferase Ste14